MLSLDRLLGHDVVVRACRRCRRTDNDTDIQNSVHDWRNAEYDRRSIEKHRNEGHHIRQRRHRPSYRQTPPATAPAHRSEGGQVETASDEVRLGDLHVEQHGIGLRHSVDDVEPDHARRMTDSTE